MTSAGEQGETGYEGAPPEVILQISDDVPPEHRDAIQASVATLARRSAEASRRALERLKARNQLRTAMAGPLRKLIEEDANASEALAAVSRQREQDRLDQPPQEPMRPTVKVVERLSREEAAAGFADQVFGPPFHFQWAWHNGGPPARSFADRVSGRIELDTFADDNRGWSDVHAGFGVALSTDRVKSVIGRSGRNSNYRYVVDSDWPSGVALAEGGIEMTALENGILVSSASDKRFRGRVSVGDDARDEWPGWTLGESINVDFVMRPGRGYTFNVGAWVVCQADGGFASAQIHANAWALTAFFTD
jgi:hypothetical protein